MTGKHTQGEWIAKQTRGIWDVMLPDGRCIAECMNWETEGSSEANARLIAAAPQTAAERDNLKAALRQMTNNSASLLNQNETLKSINANLLEALEGLLAMGTDNEYEAFAAANAAIAAAKVQQ